MKKTNIGLSSRTVVFEGGVRDYKSLLKAIELALETARSANNFYVHKEPEKIVRMNFSVSPDGSSRFRARILESSDALKSVGDLDERQD